MQNTSNQDTGYSPIVNPTPVVVSEPTQKTPLSTYLGYTALILFVLFLLVYFAR